MYAADRRTHLGYLRSGGPANNGGVNSYQSVAEFYPRGGQDLPRFRIFDLDAPGVLMKSILKDHGGAVQNLRQEIDEKRLREDLYFRLNVIHIHVPPLRERKNDTPLLADPFLGQQCEENGVPKKQLMPESVESLKSTDWAHSNVRELENLISSAPICIGS